MPEEISPHSSVMIIANGGMHVGWGHIMRCSSIGCAVESLGGSVLFAAMNRESASLISSLGFDCRVVEPSALVTSKDSEAISSMALDLGIQTILIDSYDVSETFFSELRKFSFKVGYIDDLYMEGIGSLMLPRRFDVELVVNYGFAFDDGDYVSIYGDTSTRCLVGPLFAPIRENFSHFRYSVASRARRVLLTTGSTNPSQALERMLLACDGIDANVEIHVVVGKNAVLEVPETSARRVTIHEGVSDLSGLMAQSDIVVSSAGSTLYELCCMGIPTIALPVVQNQLCNARGFRDRGLGLSHIDLEWTSVDVAAMLKALIGDFDARSSFSSRMRTTVDGRGSERIAKHLIGCD